MKNPFPSDGDASHIPEFTDFLICRTEERIRSFQEIIIPLLNRANSGESGELHDSIIIGEIGRGKTHLLKFLEKKLQGKPVKLISPISLPNYINILPVYVKLDASTIASPPHFVYFMLSYMLGYGSDQYGLINTIEDPADKTVILEYLKENYDRIIDTNIRTPSVISIQQAFQILFNVVNYTLKITGKKSVIFLLDELEGIILTASAQASLRIIMDFLRQFHDSINKHISDSANIYAFYAMTAPAYQKSTVSREATAWLSRLRNTRIHIPLLSFEEFLSLVSTALHNEDENDISPFSLDSLTYIYRSVMGQPRYAIESLYNAYSLHITNKLEEIQYIHIYSSTPWLNPSDRIDSQKINKLIVDLGPRYGYLVQYFADSIGKYQIMLSDLLAKLPDYKSRSISEERVISDINTIIDRGYVEEIKPNEVYLVKKAFYDRIINELEVDGPDDGLPIVLPISLIESASKDIITPIDQGIYESQQIGMISYTLDNILRKLFVEDGIKETFQSNNYKVYTTRKSKKGNDIKILTGIFINDKVDISELYKHILNNNVDLCLFVIDYSSDNMILEETVRSDIEDLRLPSKNKWINDIFTQEIIGDNIDYESVKQIQSVMNDSQLVHSCIFYNIREGQKEYRTSEIGGRLIDTRGLWYASQGIVSQINNPEMGQLVESQLNHIYQVFYGKIRSDLISLYNTIEKTGSTVFNTNNSYLRRLNVLLSNEKTLEQIKNQSIIETPLPSGINPNNISKIASDLGVFTKQSATRWRVNSLLDASKINPWIYFIYRSRTMGLNQLNYGKISSINQSLLTNLLDYYGDIIEKMQYYEDGVPRSLNKKETFWLMYNNIHNLVTIAFNKEFKNSSNDLKSINDDLENIKLNIDRIESGTLDDLNLDHEYVDRIEALGKLEANLEQKIEKISKNSHQYHNELNELYENLNLELVNTENLYALLNFDARDSEINDLIRSEPILRDHILSIDFNLTLPTIGEKIEQEYIDTMSLFDSGFYSSFLSIYQAFKRKINSKNRELIQYRTDVSETIKKRYSFINNTYHKLTMLSPEYRMSQNNNISNAADTARNKIISDTIESIKFTAKAESELLGSINKMEMKISNQISIEIKTLTRKIDSVETFFERALKEIQVEQNLLSQNVDDITTIRSKINSLTDLNNAQPYLDNKTNYVRDINISINSIKAKKGSIEANIENLEKKMMLIIRKKTGVTFSKIIKYLSNNPEITYDNYSDLIKLIGTEEEVEKMIFSLLKLGIISIGGTN
jgi:hypothetical protein